MKRDRGTGSLYRQTGCATWSMKFSVDGKIVRKSTGETDKRLALIALNKQVREVAAGAFVGAGTFRVRVAELAEGYLRDYRINPKKSIGHAKSRWEHHLAPFFSTLRASAVTSDIMAGMLTRGFRKAHRPRQSTVNWLH